MEDFQSKVTEIKAKADIVDIIGEHVKLERKGNNFFGLCPFHDDKHPSMSVSPEKQIYKCFSCNASGDSITFIKNLKKISYSSALKEVGERVGVHIEPSKADIIRQQNQKYYDILSDTAIFYSFYLKNTIEGQAALKYLENRKINPDVISRFKIGLSSSDNDLLYKALLEKNHLAVDMIEAGVIKGNNNYFDFFKKRIIFPITDLEGNIVGFSGRKYLPNSEESKYVNSSENNIFKKGQILYNYNEAFNYIKSEDNVFLFEGFMDVIAAYRANVFNCVASMGTALTNNQISAIKRVTNNITLCYDGDAPGIEASKRAILLLTNSGCNISVIVMEDGLDPDEYINKYGEQALYNHLQKEKVSAIEYLYEIERKDLIPSNIESVEKFKNEMFKHLSMFNSNVIVERCIKRMSEDLNISVNGLLEDFRGNKPRFVQETKEVLIPISNKKIKNRTITKLKKYDRIQKELINIALNHPEKCLEIESKFNNNYVNNENREIMLQIHQYYYTHNELNNDIIKSKLEPSLVSVFDEILNMEFPDYINRVDMLFSAFDQYPADKLTFMLTELENKSIDDTASLAQTRKSNTKIIYSKRSDSND